MSTLKTNRVQLGQSGTATQNFTLTADAADGTMKLARGVAGATTQDIMTINALGEVDFPQLVRSYGANGYQKLPGGLIIQWGAVGGSASAAVPFTYPIAFPTALRSLVMTVAIVPGGSGSFATVEGQGLTGGSYQSWTSTSTRVALTGYYIAIGY